MSNRIPTTARLTFSCTLTGQPDGPATRDARGEEKDYSFDELRDIPFPPCTTTEYAALQEKLFRDGRPIFTHDRDKAGQLMLEFLTEGKTVVAKWLMAQCGGRTIAFSTKDYDATALARLCDLLRTVPHDYPIKLSFASLQALDHVASNTAWRSLAIGSDCACASSASPGLLSLDLTSRDENERKTFARLVLTRSASAVLRLWLCGRADGLVAVELVTAMLRANSLESLELRGDANVMPQMFDTLALNVASRFVRLSLPDGELTPEKEERLAALVSGSRFLRELHIHMKNRNHAVPNLLPALASNTSLKSFTLFDTGLGKQTLMQLCMALARNPCLKELRIGENSMDGAGVKEVADRFCGHDGLYLLELRLSSPGWASNSAEAGIAMADLVRSNPRLRILYLSAKEGGAYRFQGEGHRRFVEATMTSRNLWEVGYDFSDSEAAAAHFRDNSRHFRNLVRAGLTLASLDTPLPSEVEEIFNAILLSIYYADRTALDGLADFTAQVLTQAPAPAMYQLV